MAKYIIGDIFKGDYPISQFYAQRPEYYKQFGLNGHEGVDWATPTGVEIVAPFDGEILRDAEAPGDKNYGNFIAVWDPKQKIAVWFAHLLENYVSLGQKVKKGQVLGKTDNSGNSSGAHLHVNLTEGNDQKERLNTKNGYQGFLNILDPKLVEWKLGNTATPVPADPINVDDDHKRAYEHLDFYRKERLDGQEGSYEGYIRALTGRDSKYSSLASELSTVKGQLASTQDEAKRTIDDLTAKLLVSETQNSQKDDVIATLREDLKTCQNKPTPIGGNELRAQIQTILYNSSDFFLFKYWKIKELVPRD